MEFISTTGYGQFTSEIMDTSYPYAFHFLSDVDWLPHTYMYCSMDYPRYQQMVAFI